MAKTENIFGELGGSGGEITLVAYGQFSGGAGNSASVSGLTPNKKYLLIICGAGASATYATTYANSLTTGTGYTYESVSSAFPYAGQSGSNYGCAMAYYLTPTQSSIALMNSQTGSNAKYSYQIYGVE